MVKYKHKPTIVEAYQFNPLFEHKTHLPYPIRGIPSYGADNWAYMGCKFYIDAPSGVCEIFQGDWIVKDEKGYYCSYNPDDFKTNYELVEE